MQSISHLFYRLPGRALRCAGMLAIAGALLCPVAQAASAAAGNYTLFTNANIVDMEDGSDTTPRAGQVLVRDGDIVAINTEAGMASWLREHQIGQVINTIDLNGDILMPGFIEPHAHLATMAQMAQMADISPCWPSRFEMRKPYDSTSPDNANACPLYINDAVTMLYSGQNAKSSKGKWIVGNGIDPSRMTTVAAPGKDQTRNFVNDPALYLAKNLPAPKNQPVFLLDQSGHVAYVNQEAMRRVLKDCKGENQCPNVSRALITSKKYQPDDPSARYEFHCTKATRGCNYTGRLLETGAYKLFLEHIISQLLPEEHLFNESPKQFVKEAQPIANALAKAGITTLANGGAMNHKEVSDLQALLTPTSQGPDGTTLLAPLRVVTLLAWNATMQAKSKDEIVVPLSTLGLDIWQQPGQRFGIQGVKLWADGSTQGCSAALTKDYAKKGLCAKAHKGHANYTSKDIQTHLQPFWDAGWYINVHANGDHAIRNTITALNALGKGCASASTGACGKTHTLIHFTVSGNGADNNQVVPDEVNSVLAARANNIDLTTSLLIGHVAYWGAAFQDILDGVPKNQQNDTSDPHQRVSQLDAARSLRDNKIPFSLHSDGPVSPTVPLWLAEQAVTRKTWVYPDLGTADKSQSITMPGEQGISFHDALRAITAVPARQHQLFDRIGSIRVGKKADFVRLAKIDYEAALLDASKISTIKVIGTYLDGTPVDYFPTAQ